MCLTIATSTDCAALSAIAIESFLQEVAPHLTAEGIEVFRQYATSEAILDRIENNSLFWLVQTGDRPVGMAELRGDNHLAMLFVSPQSRLAGIGRSLLNAIEPGVRARGSHVLSVNASPNSAQFYEKMGFRKLTEEQTENGIRFTPMEKALVECPPQNS